jgi:DNA polymerase/3'-5' exonuclease PolX
LEIFNKKECEIASVINAAEEQITKAPIKNTACENMEYKQKLNEIISENINSSIV